MVAIAHQEVGRIFPSAASTGARGFVGKAAIVVGASANIAYITGLARFLVSPQARWMTGTISIINGDTVSPISCRVEGEGGGAEFPLRRQRFRRGGRSMLIPCK